MRDDQIHGLLRTLEEDREPDPAFADDLYDRLAAVTRDRGTRRLSPMLLVAAVILLGALGVGVALGAGLLRLPLVVDASPDATVSAAPAASGASSATPMPSAAVDPMLAGRTVVATADRIALRSTPTAGSALVRRLNAGQAMSIVSGPVDAEDMRWYEVRIGPGATTGWVASGPDGDWLRLVDDGLVAVRCEGCPGGPIVTMSVDGTLVSDLGGTAEYSSFAWSPNGTRLAQTVDDGGATAHWTSVVVMNADGSNARTLGGSNGPVAWSPDGTRLAWTFDNDLMVTDEELVPRPLGLDAPGVRQPMTPSWSPDGTFLAFEALDCPTCDTPVAGDAPHTLFSVRADGSELRTLLEPNSDTLDGGWAPDGSRLLLTRGYVDGRWAPRAFTVPADGGEPEFLPEGLVSPVWSPDGTRMAWSGADGLHIADGDSANARLLVPAVRGEVHWAPSGSLLLYGVANDDGATQSLWVVAADGSEPPRRVTPDGVSATNADWQAVLVPLP